MSSLDNRPIRQNSRNPSFIQHALPQSHPISHHSTHICRPYASLISRSTIIRAVPAVLFSLLTPSSSRSEGDGAADIPAIISDIDPRTDEPQITTRVSLDISIDSQPSRRLILGLYGDIAPKTVSNFLCLLPQYAHTPVYRIIPGLTIQLGDVLRNGGKSGKACTESGVLQVENNRVSHSMRGIVSMVTDKERKEVDSRFFITTRRGDSLYLDGKFVAFGRVVEGLQMIDEIEQAVNGWSKKKVEVVRAAVVE